MAAPADVVELGATTSLASAPVFEYTWRLEGLTPETFSGAAPGDFVESPTFQACGVEWRLALAPKGFPDDPDFFPDDGFVGLRLQVLTPNADLRVAVVGVRCFERAVNRKLPPLTPVTNYFHLLKPATVLDKFASYVPGGVLTLEIALQKLGLVTNPNEADVTVPESDALARWAALLSSGAGADVTLLCGQERVQAHSLVLTTHSPVFAAQLAGPLRTDASAVVVPEEITPPTLRRLLQFIYSDHLEPETAEEAQHLLNAADVYGCARLARICERTLVGALSVENAAVTLTLAEQHSAAALKDAALRFVAANAVEVMKTDGWAHLLASRPTLIAEAMHTMATGEPPAAIAAGAAGGSGAASRKRAR